MHWENEVLTFLVIVLALAVCLWSFESEPAIRLTGGILQFLGLVTVAIGIHQTRKDFLLPSIRERWAKWIEDRPLRGKSVTISGIGAVTSTGRVVASGGPPDPGPDASVEDRIAALERNQKALLLQAKEFRAKIDGNHAEVQRWIEREQEERKAETASVKALLDKFAVGGIYLSVMGTVWIFVGTVLSTASIEIDSLFH
jgi:hypothetical protein